jgi:hypothetical protein
VADEAGTPSDEERAMKTTKRGKLTISRETLVLLDSTRLAEIRGGGGTVSCQGTCSCDSCLGDDGRETAGNLTD